MYKESDSASNYTKLIDITAVPQLGGTPNLIDTTTLSDGMQTYVSGVVATEGFVFTANYTKADYVRLKALEGLTKSYAVWKGGTGNSTSSAVPDGSDGKWLINGQLSVVPNGGGVDEVFGMTITIVPSEVVTFDSGT